MYNYCSNYMNENNLFNEVIMFKNPTEKPAEISVEEREYLIAETWDGVGATTHGVRYKFGGTQVDINYSIATENRVPIQSTYINVLDEQVSARRQDEPLYSRTIIEVVPKMDCSRKQRITMPYAESNSEKCAKARNLLWLAGLEQHKLAEGVLCSSTQNDLEKVLRQEGTFVKAGGFKI